MRESEPEQGCLQSGMTGELRTGIRSFWDGKGPGVKRNGVMALLLNSLGTEKKPDQEKQSVMASLNRRIIRCQACRLSVTRSHALTGEGSLHARMLFVALSPGAKEDTEGRMFIGPSGKILNALFNAAGVARSTVYMTNLIKCMLPKNRRPKMDEIGTCSPFLTEEISIVRPGVIVPLGYYATRAVFHQYEVDAPAARTDYASCYGQLVFSKNQKIFPLPHPSSLIYRPDYMPATRKKYQKLRVLSADCKWYPVCPMKYYYENGWLEKKWIALYCQGDWENCVRYEMEDKGDYHPDWMLPDGRLNEYLRKRSASKDLSTG